MGVRGQHYNLVCPGCRTEFHQRPTYRVRNTCSRICLYRVVKWRNYGLTPKMFWLMWDEQAGLCAMPMCFSLLRQGGGSRRSVHIDHDHDTGLIRGLLCPDCNTRVVGGYEVAVRLGVREYLGVAA